MDISKDTYHYYTGNSSKTLGTGTSGTTITVPSNLTPGTNTTVTYAVGSYQQAQPITYPLAGFTKAYVVESLEDVIDLVHKVFVSELILENIYVIATNTVFKVIYNHTLTNNSIRVEEYQYEINRTTQYFNLHLLNTIDITGGKTLTLEQLRPVPEIDLISTKRTEEEAEEVFKTFENIINHQNQEDDIDTTKLNAKLKT